MPKGRGHRYSLHEHEMASHIIESEMSRGFSRPRSEEIAWGKINLMRKRR